MLSSDIFIKWNYILKQEYRKRHIICPTSYLSDQCSANKMLGKYGPGQENPMQIYCDLETSHDLEPRSWHTVLPQNHLCQIWSCANKTPRKYGPDKKFLCKCTVTLTLKSCTWVKVMTHRLPTRNICAKYEALQMKHWENMAWTRKFHANLSWPWP